MVHVDSQSQATNGLRISISMSENMDTLYDDPISSSSSSFSNGPMTPFLSSSSSSRRPSLASPNWIPSQQQHFAACTMAPHEYAGLQESYPETSFSSMDTYQPCDQYLKTATPENFSFLDDHTAVDGFMLPINHSQPPKTIGDWECVGFNETSPLWQPQILRDSGDHGSFYPTSPISSRCNMDVQKATFEPCQPETQAEHQEYTISMTQNGPPQTVVPSQTFALPVTPQAKFREPFQALVKSEPILEAYPTYYTPSYDSSPCSTDQEFDLGLVRAQRNQSYVTPTRLPSRLPSRLKRSGSTRTRISGISISKVTTEPAPPHGKKTECTECGNRFKRPEHLKRHELTHTKDQRFECKICQKRFGRSDNLNQHYKTHIPRSLGGTADKGHRNKHLNEEEAAAAGLIKLDLHQVRGMVDAKACTSRRK
ncbi:hypothetical protein MMC09_001028 [Bachmanniomyces sp. S44760]|nr:hypothetical protein [Bachmanniomyces sp. S44760]